MANIPQQLVSLLRWLCNTRRSEPWTFRTILAGLCLFAAALFAGSAGGSALIVVFDVFGDILALFLISHMTKEPMPDDPDYVPGTRGRREAAVTVAVLSAVMAATLLRMSGSMADVFNEVGAWYRRGTALTSPVPTHWLPASLFLLCNVAAAMLFVGAYRAAVRSRDRSPVPAGTQTTLSANLVTGTVNMTVQGVLLLWVWLLRPWVMTCGHPKARTDMAVLDPFLQAGVNVLALLSLGGYVLWRCSTDAKAQWGPLVGRPAPTEVTLYFRALLADVKQVKSVYSVAIDETGPEDAVMRAEIDIERPAQIQDVEADIDKRARQAALFWQSVSGSDAAVHSIRPQIRWLRCGEPAALAESYAHTAMAPRTADLLPIFHEDVSSNRIVTQAGPETLFRPTEASTAAPIRIDSSVVGDEWDKVVEMQAAVARSIADTQAETPQRILYFGLGGIPQTVQFGYELGDAKDILIRQFDPRRGRWYDPAEPHGGEVVTFSLEHTLEDLSKYAGPVAVAVEVSSNIRKAEVDKVLGTGTPVVRVKASAPNKSMVLSNTELADLGVKFGAALDGIKKLAPGCDGIHLFCATPCGASLQIGRHISTTMYGKFHLYHYDAARSPQSQRVITLPYGSLAKQC